MKHLLALIVLVLSAVAAAVDPTFAWPHGQHAAIVLTYDDAVPSDLKVALKKPRTGHSRFWLWNGEQERARVGHPPEGCNPNPGYGEA